jgi:CheY-like chemotaxis protein
VIALDGLLKIIRKDQGLEEMVVEIEKNGDRHGEASEEPGLLGRAQVECERMRRMLVDLESVSDIQNRELESREVSLQSWLDGLVDGYADSSKQAGVRVNTTCDNGTYDIHAGFLEEIFTNLFENALKYGCTAEAPRIDVAGRIVGDHFELSVADNGDGIAPEYHHKVFEPFRRLDPAASSGSGIGLLAVKRLVHRLGGSVHLDSESGKGAKFLVRVPLLTQEDDSEGIATRRPRVLLVEDDLLDARSIERHLGKSHTITRVQDIKEADTRLSSERFDVVILDLSLPDGHGLELAHRMADKPFMRTPIVVVTAHGQGIDNLGSDSAVSACLSKSDITRPALLDAIEIAMRPRAMELVGEGASGAANSDGSQGDA